MGFAEDYDALESRLRTHAEQEHSVYFPNVQPRGPVDWIMVCMEPSLLRWNRRVDNPSAGIEPGARNFVSSPEDFVLHHCARRYLPGRYHVTDLAKGGMSVKQARVARRQRWDRWYPLLLDEIRLVGKMGVRVVAVGAQVSGYLRSRGLPYPLEHVMHYSGLAAHARNALVNTRESEFRRYAATVSADDFRSTALEVLAEARLPASLHDAALARLGDAALTESRLKLMFIYKQAFEEFVRRRDTSAGPR